MTEDDQILQKHEDDQLEEAAKKVTFQEVREKMKELASIASDYINYQTNQPDSVDNKFLAGIGLLSAHPIAIVEMIMDTKDMDILERAIESQRQFLRAELEHITKKDQKHAKQTGNNNKAETTDPPATPESQGNQE